MSLCVNCNNSRKACVEGYAACSLGIGIRFIPDWLIEAEEIAIGWADLREPVNSTNKSGVITNGVMLTKKVTNCLKLSK